MWDPAEINGSAKNDSRKCKHITQSLINTILFISFIPNGSAEIRVALQTYAGLSLALEDGSSFSCSIRRKVFTFSSISSAEYLDIIAQKSILVKAKKQSFGLYHH